MTGSEFEQLMKANSYTQTSLGERWGVVRQTIGNCCKSEVVDPIYADAIKSIAYEKQVIELMEVVKLFNNKDEKS